MPDDLTTSTAEPLTGEVTQAEAAAMMRAAFKLFAHWRITDAQAQILLGQPSASTFYRWKGGEIGTIPHEAAWRLGNLIGIHKALRCIFMDRDRAYA
jgi:hypothetical protein